MTVYFDFETRSEADLRKVGAWAYSEHPSTEVICCAWAADDGPVEGWINPDLGTLGRLKKSNIPEGLRKLVSHDTTFEAHNVAFEIAIWENVCARRYGWPKLRLDRWRDTMAVACYYALPAALDNLAKVLGLPGKDPEGARLITRYSKLHLQSAKIEIPQEDRFKFLAYCKVDTGQERECANILGELPEEEEDIFLRDLMTAYRGLRIDLKGVKAATAVVKERSTDLQREFRVRCGFNPSQVLKFREWLDGGRTIPHLPDLRADTIEEALDEGRVGDEPLIYLAPEARELLDLRRQHARASTKKLDAMARQCGQDGRARFQTRYHGAMTGRNTGTGFQPLNLSRGFEDVPPEELVSNIMVGSPKWLDAMYGDAMEAVGKASRHWIVPGPGKKIVAGDFVSIEAVVNAWMAGEQWKVDAFRRGDPVYELMACRIHNLGPEAEALAKRDKKAFKARYPKERFDGKTGELGFGYQGAVAAWRKFDRSGRYADEEIAAICRTWRGQNQAIVESWYELERTCLQAVLHPAQEWVCQGGMTAFERVDGWLTMILPDEKRLWYWAPQAVMAWPHNHLPAEKEECADGSCGHRKQLKVTYQAQKEGQWRRVGTYGGKLCENRTQGYSRQLLKFVEAGVADEGIDCILSVYDEIVCEVPEDGISAKELQELMEALAREFNPELPVSVDAWEGLRYKK